MPITIADAIDESGTAARAKADLVRDVPRYLLASMLAGAYIGVAVVLLVSVGAPLVAGGSPFAKLVQGAVFGVALTLIVFAGAELFTGNAMTMLQGLARRRVRPLEIGAVWIGSLVGNLAGSVVFAAAVHGAGVLDIGASAGKPAPARALLASMVAAKEAAGGSQLFWRAVLCNALVCVGLWMAARTRSDTAKCIVLWWALLAFIASGFEHSVANMTTFALAAMDGSGTWAMLARNLLWTVPGNLVGGALVVGGAYAWLGHRREAPEVLAPPDLAIVDEAVADTPA